MYFAVNGSVRARAVGARNGVQQRNAVVRQQGVHLVEELAVVRQADMLEHTDRDDAVEAAGQRTVVDQLVLHVIGYAGRSGALAGDLELFL